MQQVNIICETSQDINNLIDYIKPRFNNYNGFYTKLIIKCNVTDHKQSILLNIVCKSKYIFTKLKRELNLICGVAY